MEDNWEVNGTDWRSVIAIDPTAAETVDMAVSTWNPFFGQCGMANDDVGTTQLRLVRIKTPEKFENEVFQCEFSSFLMKDADEIVLRHMEYDDKGALFLMGTFLGQINFGLSPPDALVSSVKGAERSYFVAAFEPGEAGKLAQAKDLRFSYAFHGELGTHPARRFALGGGSLALGFGFADEIKVLSELGPDLQVSLPHVMDSDSVVLKLSTGGMK